MSLRVALLAAECEPWAKVGGLADVVDALARALGGLPEAVGGPAAPVDVLLPRYRSVRVPADAVVEPPLEVPDPRGGGTISARIVRVAADGYRLRLVDVPAAFDRDGFYDHPDDPWRFAVFCRVALAALKRDGTPLDLLHVHDWHAAPALLERARGEAAGDPFYRDMAVLVTLHNLAYHGWVPLAKLGQLGLRQGEPLAGGNPFGIDLLLTAIERCELANTVSPGFAGEALTPAFGMGLDGALLAKGDRFFGILNGIDRVVWDPGGDPVTAAPYGPDDLVGKEACRRDLLTRLGFDADDPGPVLGSIGRMDPQKGFDLLADAVPALLGEGLRVVVQGVGHDAEAAPVRALAEEHPGRVALVEQFDPAMARRIYAGADLFAMPSRFEPCGLGQMIALRYGTPPVVRRTGGLADTVVDVDEDPAAGTGFVFDEATPRALAAAVTRAMRLRAGDAGAWTALQRRAMAEDFGWEGRPAQQYLEAYRRAVALRRR